MASSEIPSAYGSGESTHSKVVRCVEDMANILCGDNKMLAASAFTSAELFGIRDRMRKAIQTLSEEQARMAVIAARYSVGDPR